ncbi:MAG TPA: hypothetical protein VMZ05_05850 [Spirochaetota bacterium]|nr:hypothetical protein [Spirochaetota bacterium]
MEKKLDKPEITHRLIELLGDNFSYEEIIIIGRRFHPDFEIKTAENQYGRLRLPPHAASEHLVNSLRNSGEISELLRFLIDLDCHSLNGREIRFCGLEDLLVVMRQFGIGYDLKKREFFLVSERECAPKWEECLQENKEYDFAYVSVDIVKSSEMALHEDIKLVERTVNALFDMIRISAIQYGGSIWSWQGDGGIIAFWGPQFATFSVYFSMEALGLLPLFNLKENAFKNDVTLRFGVDSGKTLYRNDKGNIISPNINFAAHLEKKCTEINSITISDRVYDELNEKQRTYFRESGELENRNYFSFSPTNFYSSSAKADEIGKHHDRSAVPKDAGDDNERPKRKRFF